MSLQASNFHLLGGALCLDFANSTNWNTNEKPYDLFWDYQAFLQWGLQLGVFTLPQAERLMQLASEHDPDAQAVLEKARGLRQAIYRIFSSAADGVNAPDEDMALLNETLSAALPNRQVRSGQDGFVWAWSDEAPALDSLLWRVVQSAGDLLTSEQLKRVKRCDGCGWLFLDTTHGGQRRWCDMSICGNRAKARRHYARGKSEA